MKETLDIIAESFAFVGRCVRTAIRLQCDALSDIGLIARPWADPLAESLYILVLAFWMALPISLLIVGFALVVTH